MHSGDKNRLNQVGIPDRGAGGKLSGDSTRGVGDIVEDAIEEVSTLVPPGGTVTVTGNVTASGTVTGANVTATATVTGADITCTDDLTTVDLFVTGDVTLGTSKTIALTTSAIFKDAVGGNTLLTVSDEGTTGSLANNTGGRVVSKLGTSSARPILIGLLNKNTTAVGNIDTGADDLISYTLPANVFTANNDGGLRITAWGTGANNADAKTVTLDFGSQTIMTQALTGSQVNNWRITALVFRTGASTQDIFAEFIQTGTAVVHKQTITAGTQTETGTIVIKCTGDGITTNNIVQEGLLVEAL